jgi:ribosome-associated toxin RatA of RatAB toxin-antitoxin module
LDYEFSNKLFALAIGPVFGMVAQTFMDEFVKQAKVLYG